MPLPDAFLWEYPVLFLVAPPSVDTYHVLGLRSDAAWITVSPLQGTVDPPAERKRTWFLKQLALQDSTSIVLVSRKDVLLGDEAVLGPMTFFIGEDPSKSIRAEGLPGSVDAGGMLLSFLMLQPHHWPDAARILNRTRVEKLGLAPILPED